MLRLLGPPVQLCEGLSRREALRIGGFGFLGSGLGLADLARAQSTQFPDRGPRFGQARSCIVLFLIGGPPQHSTWDPKPETPPEVRGAFGPIDTIVPGLQISELLPRTALHADKLCLLRAMSTGDNAHSSSGYYMLTGRPHAPKNFENANPGAPNDFPSLGAMAQVLLPPSSNGLPAGLTLPHRISNTDGSVWPGQDAGFLGRATDPWLLRVEESPGGPRVAEVALPAGLAPERLGRRKDLLEQLSRLTDSARSIDPLDAHSRRAFELLLSSRARSAFRLDEESASTRERYGKSPFGQHVLLARRLVESGVRLVQVNWYRGPGEPDNSPVWDSHFDETNRLKTVLCPPFDAAFSALLEDLSARGLLDETLVLCISEFGRTPRFEPQGGRGHWGSVFSVVLAGGGVRGGQVHGASDRIGAYPMSGRVLPEDLLATALHQLGIPPETELHDRLGRPLPASRGQVLHAIL